MKKILNPRAFNITGGVRTPPVIFYNKRKCKKYVRKILKYNSLPVPKNNYSYRYIFFKSSMSLYIMFDNQKLIFTGIYFGNKNKPTSGIVNHIFYDNNKPILTRCICPFYQNIFIESF